MILSWRAPFAAGPERSGSTDLKLIADTTGHAGNATAPGESEMLNTMKLRALEQVKEAGRKGLQVERGWESVTQCALVEEGLLWQEHGKRGHWKFTLSPSGERAL